jgi:hypothetical protein
MNAPDAPDISVVAEFLADQQVQLSHCDPVDCIVICASAILFQAEQLFEILEQRPNLTKTLVLCGGKGHSTCLLYEAVAASPKYAKSANEIQGLPEARVLEKLLNGYCDVQRIKSAGCHILIEDQSSNCGANAIETRKVLAGAGAENIRRCVIIQDPTMALRTKASFRKAFEDVSSPPEFLSCPVFVPCVRMTDASLEYVVSPKSNMQLWDMSRFLELSMGEIPRLRDDQAGYGPMGKGYIPHVDIPPSVEVAYKRLFAILDRTR